MDLDLSFLDGRDLAVYSAGWCGDCRRLKRFLDAAGIAYRTIDIDAQAGAAEKLEQETGKRAIPFVLVDSRAWVRGYHKELPARFDPQLFFSELRAAVA
jgi:glutaredoxin